MELGGIHEPAVGLLNYCAAKIVALKESARVSPTEWWFCGSAPADRARSDGNNRNSSGGDCYAGTVAAFLLFFCPPDRRNLDQGRFHLSR